MGALLVLAVLAQAPQGVSVRLATPELSGAATADEAELVAHALGEELALQGYEVSRLRAGKALVVGKVERTAEGAPHWRLRFSLVDAAAQVELDEVRLTVGARAELPNAGREAARALASAIRVRWGVRAKLKLGP